MPSSERDIQKQSSSTFILFIISYTSVKTPRVHFNSNEWNLFKTFKLLQLRAILQISSAHIYLNPWYNSNQILVKASPEDFYSTTTKNLKTDNVFYLIDESGDITKMEIDKDDSLDKLKPGFFKLDKELVYTFLERSTNGK